MITRTILAALCAVLAAALCAALVWLFFATRSLTALQGEVTALRFDAAACEARNANILEDKERDDEIDNIPDFGLPDFVPDSWMRQAD